jgi:hypothetical protein
LTDSSNTSALRDSVRAYFEAAPGALRNHLNAEELARITVTALLAGAVILGILEAILACVGTLFPAPTDAAFAGVIVTFLLDCLRRLDHGRPLSSDAAPDWHPRRGGRDPGRRS